jgi:predicted N-formylglutamate amidohydrolase
MVGTPPSDAFEIYGRPEPGGPLVLTCEHASARVPRPLRVADADRPWLATHWAVDIGAAVVARELIRRTGSVGVLARFSRLVCDANRPPDSPTWLWQEIGGYRPTFNREVSDAERERRRRSYWEPYHAAIDRTLAERRRLAGEVLLLAVHTFTPELDGRRREMEIGVLFNHHATVAERLAGALREEGLRAALNEPYSGREGLMFSVDRHGGEHAVTCLEIEVRQDLVAAAAPARRLGARLARVLGTLARGNGRRAVPPER